MDKYIGRLLDNRYEILEVIGTGGMAVVYKALCHRLNRLVAIKILKDEFFQDEEFRRRFHAESQAVAMLSHPNIVSVYDVSTSGDADYIVMELVEGITLKQYMEKKGVLNWRETLHFSMQIAKALEHAHSKGIVHRDIKPHNVMILKNGTAKVTDFGIARIMSSTNTLTKEALGSVHYISPEQAKGGRVDNRSDIYSLGVVMYEMMTGQPPYDGDSPVAIALKHINGGATMPSVLNPNIPGGLEQIIMKAMAVDPDRRYTSATEMLYDMEEFRKNPAILFYYDNFEAPAARPSRPVGTYENPGYRPAPRNTAERVAGVRPEGQRPRTEGQRPRPEGQRPRQDTGRNYQSTGRPRQDTSRSRLTPQEPEEEETSKKNKTTTTAIIAVVGVVVLVVLYFAISALAKSIFGGQATIEVPDFKGKVYEELNPDDYKDFVLTDKIYAYSDTYEKGQIVDQNPKAHTQAKAGTTIEFTVSMGAQTENMPELTNLTLENAKKVLSQYKIKLTIKEEKENSQDVEAGKIIRTEPAYNEKLSDGDTVTLWVSEGPGEMKMPDFKNQTAAEASDTITAYKLNIRIQQKTENSKDVEKGKITRTDPAAGETIKKGDTVILWVSEGPEETEVPQVVGMDISKAVDMLTRSNLKYDYDYVDSDLPKDQVVTQSEKKGTKVAVDTEIYLEISKGPTEPTETEAPTKPLHSTNYTIRNLPSATDKPNAYVLSIRQDGVAVLEDMTVDPGTSEITVILQGRGVVYFDLYIDGTYYDNIRVDFGS